MQTVVIASVVVPQGELEAVMVGEDTVVVTVALYDAVRTGSIQIPAEAFDAFLDRVHRWRNVDDLVPL